MKIESASVTSPSPWHRPSYTVFRASVDSTFLDRIRGALFGNYSTKSDAYRKAEHDLQDVGLTISVGPSPCPGSGPDQTLEQARQALTVEPPVGADSLVSQKRGVGGSGGAEQSRPASVSADRQLDSHVCGYMAIDPEVTRRATNILHVCFAAIVSETLRA
jgi:hypothetical protein